MADNGAAAPGVRRIGTKVVAVLALVVAIGLGIGYFWTVSSTARDVDVRVGPPKCTGTTTKPSREVSLGMPSGTPVIQAVEGMHCTLNVTVTNEGDREVHLEDVSAAFLGSETGLAVTAEFLAGQQPEPGDLDAHADLDTPLQPGETLDFDTDLVFNPSGCSMGTTAISDFPKVRATIWGRSVVLESGGTLVVKGTSNAPGCRQRASQDVRRRTAASGPSPSRTCVKV